MARAPSERPGNFGVLSFSPRTECASTAETQIRIDDTDVFPRVVVELQGGPVDRQEKLDAWNEVYKVKELVEGEFLALREARVNTGLSAEWAVTIEHVTPTEDAFGRPARWSSGPKSFIWLGLFVCGGT